MNTLGVKQVEERLGQVKCAICKSNQFGIDSRSIKEDGGLEGDLQELLLYISSLYGYGVLFTGLSPMCPIVFEKSPVPNAKSANSIWIFV